MGNALLPAILTDGDQASSNGKAPSYIKPDGTVSLITGRDGWSSEKLENQIELAEKFGHSLGIAVKPPEGLVVIDLDVQNYSGGTSELMQDYEQMVKAYPELAMTRTDLTRSGGIHIFVRVDDLSSWRKPNGGLRKNLCRSRNGDKRGELLSSNSICITAPSYSLYSILGDTAYDTVITISSLESIGIYPPVSNYSTSTRQPSVASPTKTTVPRLRDLLGFKACKVLLGEFAYTDTNSRKNDRSLQLAGFTKEAYGVENLVKELGIELSETADELIEIVIDSFKLHQKADRILESLEADRATYTASRPEVVKQKLGITTPRGGRKSVITPDLAEEEITKAFGTIRERIRTGEIVLNDGNILERDELELVYLDLCRSTPYLWNSGLARHAILKLARKNQYDHIQEYFLDLISNAAPLPDAQWNRLDQLLFGIDDPIAAMFMPKFLIGAVNRLMRPGCPYVATPILIGGQGIGKSASAKVLFGSDFVVDDLSHELSKDDVSRAHCFFCTELSEVDGITNKSEKEAFKAFLTRCVDVYRPPYGASNITRARRFVFWGTSNSVPLNDPTGSRRFVAIDLRSVTKANPIPLAQIAQYRAEIWTRAFQEYSAGASYELDPAEQTLVNSNNNLFTTIDSWGEQLSWKLAQDPDHTCLTVDDAFVILKIPTAQQSHSNQKRLREVLESLGYESAKVSLPDGRRVTRLTRAKGQVQAPVNKGKCMLGID